MGRIVPLYTMIEPELVAKSTCSISLRSNNKIQFKEDRINYEIYGKSPYIRGIRLWKQLSCETQHAENKLMFDRLLTDDIIQHLKD